MPRFLSILVDTESLAVQAIHMDAPTESESHPEPSTSTARGRPPSRVVCEMCERRHKSTQIPKQCLGIPKKNRKGKKCIMWLLPLTTLSEHGNAALTDRSLQRAVEYESVRELAETLQITPGRLSMIMSDPTAHHWPRPLHGDPDHMVAWLERV